jgi:formamidopyrimidine-DNA glycosylase
LAPQTSPADFDHFLSGCVIRSVTRRGKHIIFDLSNEKTLMTHLRMTGRFMLLPVERELPRHTHAIFYFADELRLVFEDQRHFGFMRVLETSELGEAKELRDLAPEPFSDEFSVGYLRTVLKRSSRQVKELLLDQTKVCGLGNIYASESLFLAGVNPRKRADTLSAKKTELLYGAIKIVLKESIDHGSTLNVDPENIEGNYYGGAYEDHWRVYDQEGKPCMNCSSSIKRIVQSGRSTYFCPKCQK